MRKIVQIIKIRTKNANAQTAHSFFPTPNVNAEKNKRAVFCQRSNDDNNE
ncbi:hypothetical protein [Flavobacterium gillisiae]|nr:hypothetical protein [Flavobacterium gillisiae]